jgi:predicted transcriptional regulator of viral defense system
MQPRYSPPSPDMNLLHSMADCQAGFFTTQQALMARVSAPLLSYHTRNGKLERIQRGVYRFADQPQWIYSRLVPVWLRTDRQAVFSHSTAQAMLESHPLAEIIELTLPPSWHSRRLKLGKHVRVHFADVAPARLTRIGPLPVLT